MSYYMSNLHFHIVYIFAKLSPVPALAGLRLALFPFDPPTHPPTHHRDSSLNPIRTAATTLASCGSRAEYSSPS